MTWPSGTLTKQYLDQGTDNPSLARAELAAAIDKINLILAEVSAGAVVWHSGNDGSGSGLDADTLDTKHAPSGAIVGTTDTQTLSAKTLTSPVINTSVSGSAIETTLAGSSSKLARADAIKTYVDDAVGAAGMTRVTEVSVASTATIDLSGLGTVNRIEIALHQCQHNQSSTALGLRIGTGGSSETTGYYGSVIDKGNDRTITNGSTWPISAQATSGSNSISGIAQLTRITGNTWSYGWSGLQQGITQGCSGGGWKTLSGALDWVEIVTLAGALDGGTMVIHYQAV